MINPKLLKLYEATRANLAGMQQFKSQVIDIPYDAPAVLIKFTIYGDLDSADPDKNCIVTKVPAPVNDKSLEWVIPGIAVGVIRDNWYLDVYIVDKKWIKEIKHNYNEEIDMWYQLCNAAIDYLQKRGYPVDNDELDEATRANLPAMQQFKSKIIDMPWGAPALELIYDKKGKFVGATDIDCALTKVPDNTEYIQNVPLYWVIPNVAVATPPGHLVFPFQHSLRLFIVNEEWIKEIKQFLLRKGSAQTYVNQKAVNMWHDLNVAINKFLVKHRNNTLTEATRGNLQGMQQFVSTQVASGEMDYNTLTPVQREQFFAHYGVDYNWIMDSLKNRPEAVAAGAIGISYAKILRGMKPSALLAYRLIQDLGVGRTFGLKSFKSDGKFKYFAVGIEDAVEHKVLSTVTQENLRRLMDFGFDFGTVYVTLMYDPSINRGFYNRPRYSFYLPGTYQGIPVLYGRIETASELAGQTKLYGPRSSCNVTSLIMEINIFNAGRSRYVNSQGKMEDWFNYIGLPSPFDKNIHTAMEEATRTNLHGMKWYMDGKDKEKVVQEAMFEMCKKYGFKSKDEHYMPPIWLMIGSLLQQFDPEHTPLYGGAWPGLFDNIDTNLVYKNFLNAIKYQCDKISKQQNRVVVSLDEIVSICEGTYKF